MTFWEYVFAIALGATLSFLFSIAIFYLSEKFRRNTSRRDIRRSFSSELAFNRDYLQKQLSALKETIERVSNDEREVFPVVRFTGLSTTAYGQYVASGYIWDDLQPEDVSDLNDMLWHLSPAGERILFDTVGNWKQGHADKTSTYNALALTRDQLQEHLALLERVRSALARLGPKKDRASTEDQP